ncbi:MAG: hypothetical protein JST75_16195 [Bacteroidetes bacterium]|nr:hypothetical protein [Bacteroidota bacterium]
MRPNLLMTIILPFFYATTEHQIDHPSTKMPSTEDNPYPTINAIPLPEGYRRIDVEKKSFGEWLRNFSLKKNKTVYLYDGSVKSDQTVQFAVLNISVGNKNLQQCADAVIRLRAEYLYAQKRFSEIVFTDNNNKSYVLGPHTDRTHFDKYLEKVFSYCGTLSLEKQLHAIKTENDIGLGDVLIQGGSPGHAMIIMDMAVNKQRQKIYLLAQGYMPAQDVHVVLNPINRKMNPWYQLNNDAISTPGWVFLSSKFKTW